MIDKINNILNAITAFFFSAYDFVFDPLIMWYSIAVIAWLLFLLACVVISYFCEKCRPTMGILLLLATFGIAGFLTGATKMRNVDKQREAAREARKIKTRPPDDREDGGFFGGLFK